MSPAAYCRAVVQKSRSSFKSCVRFLLKPEQRRALAALYAFCRLVDDAVDDAENPAVARENLEIWNARLQNLKNDPHPVCVELSWAIQNFSLNPQYLADILHGMQMDLTPPNFADFAALENYCYHVAGAVGLLVAQILGYENKETEKYAYDLGLALQLTNILRDIKEDQGRGRCYIPKNILKNNDLDNFVFLFEKAEHFFDSANKIYQNLPQADQKRQKFGLALGGIYYALLQKIKAENFPVLERRVSLSKFEKLKSALAVYFRGNLK